MDGATWRTKRERIRPLRLIGSSACLKSRRRTTTLYVLELQLFTRYRSMNDTVGSASTSDWFSGSVRRSASCAPACQT